MGHGIVSNQLLINQERTKKLAAKIEAEDLIKKKKLAKDSNAWVRTDRLTSIFRMASTDSEL